jgi:transaldolase
MTEPLRKETFKRNISPETMDSNPLVQLAACGQAFWLDYIRRDFLLSGRLNPLIGQDGLSGMTSNPTIFEKAISGSSAYDAQLHELLSQNPYARPESLYEKMAVKDIQMAADLFAPIYESSGKSDGFVSLEVSPGLADNTRATVNEARRLWREVSRPNVMIKVPATREGVPAVEELIAQGINVNITLMFNMAQYEAVAGAYIRGLLRCGAPQNVSSVASFFVSRVDTVVDKILEGVGTPQALEVRGQAAIANSKMVYRAFRRIFYGEAFAALRKKGARLQRPLWASTSTKNPMYSDVMYVEALIGKNTVNTMPLETLEAFRDHGSVAKDAMEKGKPEETLAQLSLFDVDLNDIGWQLQHEGIKAFAAAFDKLVLTLKTRASSIHPVASNR